jgi:hypothetical protein
MDFMEQKKRGRRRRQQQQEQPHRRYYPHNFNIYFFHISQEMPNPHISPLDGCDDVSHFTSMSSETFEAYKMPKTVQRQCSQRTYVLSIFKKYKSLYISGHTREYTKISEWVDNVCYRLLLLPSKQTQLEFKQVVQRFFRIACRRVSECSLIPGISSKRHRRSYDFILGNKNKLQCANLNYKEG